MSVATSCANIALVKYWGKRNSALNLPAAGSLSLTLDALRTWTSVELDESLELDELSLDGVPQVGPPRERVCRFLDLVRTGAGSTVRARVTSKSAFPVAAGLASSASGFAALAVAASDAYDLELDGRSLSILARRGSGSAARSIFGGFVRMHGGLAPDGVDAYAEAIEDTAIELTAAVAIANTGVKDVGSTEGMERTRLTSPYHEAWIEQVELDLGVAIRALRGGDFDRLAEVTEGSCLAMHANAMAARPGIIYFRAPTLWAIDQVRKMRAAGTKVMFTVDAGPHLVAFTAPEHLEQVAHTLAQHPGIDRVLTSRAGEGAHTIEAMP